MFERGHSIEGSAHLKLGLREGVLNRPSSERVHSFEEIQYISNQLMKEGNVSNVKLFSYIIYFNQNLKLIL
jgi:hypothetical protein